MRKVVWSLGVVILLAQLGQAATICVPGTLASYISLGAAGCTIGVDTFGSFTKLTGQNGFTAIDPSVVVVTPSGTSTAPVLTFDLTVSTALRFESIFTYRVSGASFTGSRITASNSTSTGDGSVTDIQNLCGAGTFASNGVSGCSGTSLGPLVVISPDTDTTTFAGVSFLSVTDDFAIDGGPSGTATAGRFVDRFTANVVSSVPEPGTILITGLGAGFIFTLKSRWRKTREN